jgi:sRNA-binding carbon storage regulator CsrA
LALAQVPWCRSEEPIRLGIDAPEDVPIFRAELSDLLARIDAEPEAPASHELERAW